jgi:VWFA-related protein
MRLRPFVFASLVCISCGHAFSQRTIKIGVPLVQAGPKTISITEERDQLVKALNKADKKVPFTIVGVPLADELGPKAMAEAREQGCEFVLSLRLTDFSTSSELRDDGAQGLNYRPDYSAEMEYRIVRVADNAAFAIGSVQEEDPGSSLAAARLTIPHIAREAVADIGKGGNIPHIALPDPSQPDAESTPDSQLSQLPRACASIPNNIPHAESVRSVCQYALNLPQTMPNFMCEQGTSRYRGKNTVPFDLLTAMVRYENGKESFKEIKLNGKPAPEAITNSPGLWSTGQFGADLRNIFDPWNRPFFEFSKEAKLADRDAWVFTYRIARQFDQLWRLHAEGNAIYSPPYKGEIWVDQENGALLRFTSSAEDIPPTFPMVAASLGINYANAVFSDGSSFLLPADFTVNTAYRHEEPTRNVVQFRNCHKFRATAQIVADVPRGKNEPNAGDAASAANLAAEETEEAERIYAILREQAVREDEVQLAIENTQRLNAATAGAFARLSAMGIRRQRLLAATPGKAADNAPPSGIPETTIKVDVKFVPVTVVVRDAKGKAVGDVPKEDFELFDNGKPQPVATFAVEKAPAAGVKAPAQPDAPFVVTDVTSIPQRYVAYVFDDINSAFEDIASAREAASRHLAALPPGDRAAVFAISGTVAIDFTADRDKLQEALKKLRPHPVVHRPHCPPISNYMADLIVNQSDLEALGLATRDALNCTFGGIGQKNDKSLEARAEQVARTTAIEIVSATSMENVSLLSTLREILRRTAAARGSRSIVLISPGFLMTTPDTRQAIMEMIDNAQRNEIVVNSLDVRGLYTSVPAPNVSHSSNSVARNAYDKDETAARGDIMADLAYSTGGVFFHNNNDLDEGFRRTADAPEYMYVLGFAPQKLDGKYHKLKVTLKTPSKLQVETRKGYYALKPASK